VRSNPDGWAAMLDRTGRTLAQAGLPKRHYDIHVPMLLQRSKFSAAAAWWKRSQAAALTMKSVYGNLYCHAGVPLHDCKIGEHWRTRIDQVTADRWVLSYSDGALRAGFAEWMLARLPEPIDAEVPPQTLVCVL